MDSEKILRIILPGFSLDLLAVSIIDSIFAHFLLHEIIPYLAAHDMNADTKRGKLVAAFLIIGAVLAVPQGAITTWKAFAVSDSQRGEKNIRIRGLLGLFFMAMYWATIAWLWGRHIYFQQQSGLEV